MARPRLGH